MAGDQRIAGWVALHGIGERLADGLFEKRQHGAARVAFHAQDYTVNTACGVPPRGAHALVSGGFRARLGSQHRRRQRPFEVQFSIRRRVPAPVGEARSHNI